MCSAQWVSALSNRLRTLYSRAQIPSSRSLSSPSDAVPPRGSSLAHRQSRSDASRAPCVSSPPASPVIGTRPGRRKAVATATPVRVLEQAPRLYYCCSGQPGQTQGNQVPTLPPLESSPTRAPPQLSPSPPLPFKQPRRINFWSPLSPRAQPHRRNTL